ncbi:MAG TPA: hypothetical protein VF538_05470 [Pyrinomonadaceae bacterium]|jgi:hypothetical protein
MSVSELKLEGEGGDLQIVVDEHGWARCYLLTGRSSVFLGAEKMQTLADRLISNLADEQGEAAGAIAGRSVRWVASLSEAHHTLYFYIEDGVRVLLWQDANAEPTAEVKLSGEQYLRWREQLVVARQHEI